MKQSIVWTLLSRLTEQLVLYFYEDGKITDTKEFSERLALGTWEGLILFLRQSIANSDEVVLEEVGYFKKVNNQWIFEPAASLFEVDAMKLPIAENRAFLAEKALFHLEQGVDLLANLSDDQTLPSKDVTAELNLFAKVYGEAASELMLSDSISTIGNRLLRTARRLRGETTGVPASFGEIKLAGSYGGGEGTGGISRVGDMMEDTRTVRERLRDAGRYVGKEAAEEGTQSAERSDWIEPVAGTTEEGA